MMVIEKCMLLTAIICPTKTMQSGWENMITARSLLLLPGEIFRKWMAVSIVAMNAIPAK